MDALNFTLTLDVAAQKAIEPLAPHMSAYTLKGPRAMDNTMEIPKPVVSNIAEWLEWEEDNPDPQKLVLMESLYI